MQVIPTTERQEEKAIATIPAPSLQLQGREVRELNPADLLLPELYGIVASYLSFDLMVACQGQREVIPAYLREGACKVFDQPLLSLEDRDWSADEIRLFDRVSTNLREVRLEGATIDKRPCFIKENIKSYFPQHPLVKIQVCYSRALKHILPIYIHEQLEKLKENRHAWSLFYSGTLHRYEELLGKMQHDDFSDFEPLFQLGKDLKAMRVLKKDFAQSFVTLLHSGSSEEEKAGAKRVLREFGDCEVKLHLSITSKINWDGLSIGRGLALLFDLREMDKLVDSTHKEAITESLELVALHENRGQISKEQHDSLKAVIQVSCPIDASRRADELISRYRLGIENPIQFP